MIICLSQCADLHHHMIMFCLNVLIITTIWLYMIWCFILMCWFAVQYDYVFILMCLWSYQNIIMYMLIIAIVQSTSIFIVPSISLSVELSSIDDNFPKRWILSRSLAKSWDVRGKPILNALPMAMAENSFQTWNIYAAGIYIYNIYIYIYLFTF